MKVRVSRMLNFQNALIENTATMKEQFGLKILFITVGENRNKIIIL